MLVADAQREVRTVFVGGFAGQLVSSALWFVSAALGTWSSPRHAILAVVVGGFFIFPLTQLVLRLLGYRGALSPGNPLNGLGMQVAFTLPLVLPVVGMAASARLNWFFPALMIVLGAHYLPFVFLYGMWQFAVLAAVLIGAGVACVFLAPASFALGAWITAGALLLFALVGRHAVRAEGLVR